MTVEEAKKAGLDVDSRVLPLEGQPRPRIHGVVVEAMRELGYELTRRPQQTTETMMRDADLVVDLGCGDAIPAVPGVRKVTWDVEDPGGQPVAVVRQIRDGLLARAEELVAELRKAWSPYLPGRLAKGD